MNQFLGINLVIDSLTLKNLLDERYQNLLPCNESSRYPHETCEPGYACVADTDTEGVGMFGSIGGRHFPLTEKQCAELCMFTLDCQVYEFSPQFSQCKLVAADPPVAGKKGDWKFCKKGCNKKLIKRIVNFTRD